MSERDGGPAFPGRCDCDAHKLFVTKDGMTLRDWFAGQALAGTTAADEDGWNDVQLPRLAKYIYGIADAMLKARAAK